ncbi:hypothetical protein CLOM_g10648, partial [Closterium sp. NIES-68]
MPSMSNSRNPTEILTRSSPDANRRRHRPSSSAMNLSTRSSPCLPIAVVTMAPWSFSFVGRVMVLLRIAGFLNLRWITLVVLFATT